MNIFHNMNISATALTMNRLRMDVISSNIANAQTTRARLENGQWQPYQRKMVEIAPKGLQSFDSFLQKAMGTGRQQTEGVVARRLKADPTPFKQVYDPTHPDADEQGMVRLPNVDLLKEMVDMMSATRSYEANVTAFNAAKNMHLKALEIGK